MLQFIILFYRLSTKEKFVDAHLNIFRLHDIILNINILAYSHTIHGDCVNTAAQLLLVSIAAAPHAKHNRLSNMNNFSWGDALPIQGISYVWYSNKCMFCVLKLQFLIKILPFSAPYRSRKTMYTVISALCKLFQVRNSTRF